MAEKGLKTREKKLESDYSGHRQEFGGRLQLPHSRTAVTGSSSDTEKAHHHTDLQLALFGVCVYMPDKNLERILRSYVRDLKETNRTSLSDRL